jgi:hypothetical protein
MRGYAPMTGVSGLAGLFGGGLKQQAADAETDRLLKADATRGQIDLYGAQAEKARTDARVAQGDFDARAAARALRADPNYARENAAIAMGVSPDSPEMRQFMEMGRAAGLSPEQLAIGRQIVLGVRSTRLADKESGAGEIADIMMNAARTAQGLAAPDVLATDPNKAAFLASLASSKGAPSLYSGMPTGIGTIGNFTGEQRYDPGLYQSRLAKERADANQSNASAASSFASAAKTRQETEKGARLWDTDRGGFIDWRTGAFVPATTAEGAPIGPKPAAAQKPTYDAARGIQINADGTATPVTIDGQPIGNKPLSPADQARIDKRNREAGAARTSLDQSIAELDRLGAIAKEVKDHPGLKGITGIPGMFPNIPGTDRANAAAKLDTLKSQVAFRVLQTMRDMSKTGGALGQVSDKENQMLQNNLAALDRAQSYEEFQRELQRVVEFVDGVKSRMEQAYAAQYGAVGAPPNLPRAGEVVDGYRFRGGDPADRESWEPVGERQ